MTNDRRAGDDLVRVGTIWLGSTGNRMKVLAVDDECDPGCERALLGHVDDPEDQSWETFSSVVQFFDRAPCPSKLGIGMEVMCADQEGHVPPHCLEGYGGLWVRWRVEWFTVAEEERS